MTHRHNSCIANNAWAGCMESQQRTMSDAAAVLSWMRHCSGMLSAVAPGSRCCMAAAPLMLPNVSGDIWLSTPLSRAHLYIKGSFRYTARLPLHSMLEGCGDTDGVDRLLAWQPQRLHQRLIVARYWARKEPQRGAHCMTDASCAAQLSSPDAGNVVWC